jgi:hypothetical protein
MEGRAVRHNFERNPFRDHPCQVWFNLVQRFQGQRFKEKPGINVKLLFAM